MKQLRRGAGHRSIVFVAAVAATSIGVGQSQVQAAQAGTVTAVSGSGYGYFSNVSLFGGPATPRGPAGTTGCDTTSTTACSPSAKLPATGGREAATDQDGASAQYGPAVIFESIAMAVTTQGTTGDAGQVTTTATASGVGPGPFTATTASSTCTASAAGAKASVAIVNGQLVTKTDATTGEPVKTETIDPAPAPGTTYTGTLDHVGDRFKAVFNEQILNPDGSITVNALHLHLLGPIAVGDLIVGQSVCGLTSSPAAPEAASPAPTTAPSLQASRPAAPEIVVAAAQPPLGADVGSSASGARMTPLAATPSAASLPSQIAPVSGSGAFGYTSKISLFGGPADTRPCADPTTNKTDCRPRPAVNLPSGGSATPVTDTVPTADARYGPGIFFTSNAITVSTEGTAASATSKVDIQKVNTSGVEVFNASRVSSTCTGGSGSTMIADGVIRVSEGDPNVEGDDTNVPIPANPPPNTTHEGKIEGVGDTFRAVFNEQTVKDGTITVNAYHLYAIGPTAIGELIVGQSRCGGSGTGGSGGGTPGGGTPGTTGSRLGSRTGTPAAGSSTARGGTRRPAQGMANTGFGAFGPLLLGFTLLALGTASSVAGARLRPIARTRPPDAAA